MRRRHLFDNGYPVATATLLAGSEVLLAIARQAVRKSHYRLASSFLRLADCSQRIQHSLMRYGCTHAELAESRENNAGRQHYEHCIAGSGHSGENDPRLEPPHRAARAEPHQR
jgi:hypothetical protein